MNFPLDNAFDEHWIFVQRYQETSFNIAVRAMIDYKFTKKQILDALSGLAQIHPYLCGKVVENANTTHRFHLKHEDGNTISHLLITTNAVELNKIFQEKSAQREHLFGIENGELIHLHVWQDESRSLVELSGPHLLGDVTAFLLLFKDLLSHLDSSIIGTELKPIQKQRLPFDEKRYGWDVETQQVTPLPLPEGAPIAPDKWPSPNFQYGKYNIDKNQFNKIKYWLKSKECEASVSDLFYYIAIKLYREAGDHETNFSTILSFRPLLVGENEQCNINTSAIFSIIDSKTIEEDNIFSWMEKLNKTRLENLTPSGIMGLMNFLRCLNKSLYQDGNSRGRALLNAYLPINLFAINNFGVVDKYFQAQSFNVTEIDIQDGVPCEEVRIFTYKNNLHMHPMLSENGVFNPDSFWKKFNHELDIILSM